jgi:hypothetical protein
VGARYVDVVVPEEELLQRRRPTVEGPDAGVAQAAEHLVEGRRVDLAVQRSRRSSACG